MAPRLQLEGRARLVVASWLAEDHRNGLSYRARASRYRIARRDVAALARLMGAPPRTDRPAPEPATDTGPMPCPDGDGLGAILRAEYEAGATLHAMRSQHRMGGDKGVVEHRRQIVRLYAP